MSEQAKYWLDKFMRIKKRIGYHQASGCKEEFETMRNNLIKEYDALPECELKTQIKLELDKPLDFDWSNRI